MSRQMSSVVCLVMLLNAVELVNSARTNRAHRSVHQQNISAVEGKLTAEKTCVVLMTRSSNREFQGNQRLLDNMLKSHNIECIEVYGEDDAALRSELWGISTAHLPKERQRKYPQVFIKISENGGSPEYTFVADYHRFNEVNEMNGWIKGEMAKDPHFLQQNENLQLFVFEEAFKDLLALFKPEAPDAAGAGAPCHEYYREAQVGLKCGKHAINAVLKNLGKDAVHELQLDEMAEMVGAASHGDDYDMGTLLFMLDAQLGPGKAQSVGDLGPISNEKPISELIKGVGTIEDPNAVEEHLRAGLIKQQFDMSLDKLDWVMCNTHYHWKTYFKDPSGQFCDLDSQKVPMEVEVLDPATVGAIRCRGIILPTGK